MKRGNFVAEHMVELILVAILILMFLIYFLNRDKDPASGQIDELKKNVTGTLGVPTTAAGWLPRVTAPARARIVSTAPRGAPITTFK